MGFAGWNLTTWAHRARGSLRAWLFGSRRGLSFPQYQNRQCSRMPPNRSEPESSGQNRPAGHLPHGGAPSFDVKNDGGLAQLLIGEGSSPKIGFIVHIPCLFWVAHAFVFWQRSSFLVRAGRSHVLDDCCAAWPLPTQVHGRGLTWPRA